MGFDPYSDGAANGCADAAVVAVSVKKLWEHSKVSVVRYLRYWMSVEMPDAVATNLSFVQAVSARMERRVRVSAQDVYGLHRDFQQRGQKCAPRPRQRVNVQSRQDGGQEEVLVSARG